MIQRLSVFFIKIESRRYNDKEVETIQGDVTMKIESRDSKKVMNNLINELMEKKAKKNYQGDDDVSGKTQFLEKIVEENQETKRYNRKNFKVINY